MTRKDSKLSESVWIKFPLLSILSTQHDPSAHRPSAVGMNASKEADGSQRVPSPAGPTYWPRSGKSAVSSFTSVVPISFPSSSSQRKIQGAMVSGFLSVSGMQHTATFPLTEYSHVPYGSTFSEISRMIR